MPSLPSTVFPRSFSFESISSLSFSNCSCARFSRIVMRRLSSQNWGTEKKKKKNSHPFCTGCWKGIVIFKQRNVTIYNNVYCRGLYHPTYIHMIYLVSSINNFFVPNIHPKSTQRCLEKTLVALVLVASPWTVEMGRVPRIFSNPRRHPAISVVLHLPHYDGQRLSRTW